MSEISEAIRIMADRKRAATGQEKKAEATAVPLDVNRQIMTGLDLNYEELEANLEGLFETYRETLASALQQDDGQTEPWAIMQGVTAGFWVDGLMTGVLLAQRREQGDG